MRIVSLLLVLTYPVLVFFALDHISPKFLGLGLLTILILRIMVVSAEQKRVALLLTSIICIPLLASMVWNSEVALLFYPAMANFALLILFAGSLCNRESIVERFAIIYENPLSPEAQIYCRNVTKVWSLFFIFNGTISLVTALFGTRSIWLSYNGFISYILIGGLFAIEWRIRQSRIRGRNGVS